MAIGDEYTLGTIPSRDGTGYSPSLPTPTWAQIIAKATNEGMKTLEIIFVGLLGSDTEIDGSSAIVERQDFMRVAREDAERTPGMKPGKEAFDLAVRRTMDPDYTPVFAEMLLDFHRPIRHIVGVVLRKIT